MATIVSRLPKQLQAAIDAHRHNDFDTAASGYRKFLKRHSREADACPAGAIRENGFPPIYSRVGQIFTENASVSRRLENG